MPETTAAQPVGAAQQPEFPSRRGARALPRDLRGLRFYDVPSSSPDAPTVGVVADPQRGQLVACARVEGGSFALAPAPEQTRRLDRWGRLIATLASGSVAGVITRIGWVSRSVPSDSNLQMDYWEEASDPGAPSHVRQSYLELLRRYEQTADQREVLVWIATSLPAARGLDERLQLLAEEMHRVAALLGAAQIRVTEVLDRVDLALAIRAGYDPWHRAELAEFAAEVRRSYPERIGDMLEAAPADIEDRWREVACDGCLHRVAWVKQWPTGDVGSLFAMPLIVSPRVVRTVSWVTQLVDPDAASRRVNAEAVGADADRVTFARMKQRPNMTQRQRWAGIKRREAELGVGHAEVHHAAFVSTAVRGDDVAALDRAWTKTSTDAVRSKLRLEVLTRRQAQALTLTLPIGRGLR